MNLLLAVLLPLLAAPPIYWMKSRRLLVSIIALVILALDLLLVAIIPLGKIPLLPDLQPSPTPLSLVFMALLIIASWWVLFASTLLGGEGRFNSVALAILATTIAGLVMVGRPIIGAMALQISAIWGVFAIVDQRKRLENLLLAQRYLTSMLIGSLLLVLGLSLVSQFEATRDEALLGPMVALLALGLGIRQCLFPLHVWMPGIVEKCLPGATTMVVLTICTINVPFAALLFINHPWLISETPISQVFLWQGLATVLAASSLALIQRDISRMVAYSIIADLGYMAMGLGTGLLLGTVGALVAAFLQPLALIPLFIGLEGLRGSAEGTIVHEVAGPSKTSSGRPGTLIALIAGGLGISGLPPLAGFVGRWPIYQALAELGAAYAAVGVVGSILILIAYARAINRLIAPQMPEEPMEGRVEASMVAPLVLVPALISFAFWLYPNPLLQSLAKLASQMPPVPAS